MIFCYGKNHQKKQMMCSYETTFAPSQTKSLEVIQLQEKIDKMWVQRNRAITLLQNIEEKHQNEIKNLTEENEDNLASLNFYTEQCTELKDERKQLKEENKKLTDRLQNFKEMNWKRMDDLVKALSPWKKNHQDHTRILEAIEELKEENEMLKTEAEDVLQQVADALCGEGDEADSMCGWGHTHKLIKKANDLNKNDNRIEKMQEYIESREVKYCDTCGRYGDEHIDLECDDDGCYWCENCKDDLAEN